ncbi:hypothetical protein WA158_007861 [Blastocystis sp. Blastoise]
MNRDTKKHNILDVLKTTACVKAYLENNSPKLAILYSPYIINFYGYRDGLEKYIYMEKGDISLIDIIKNNIALNKYNKEKKEKAENIRNKYKNQKDFYDIHEWFRQHIKEFIIQILLALCTLQKHQVIWADFKPDNIVYSKDQGRFKLIDFGISLYAADGALIQPPGHSTRYVPPEYYNEKFKCFLNYDMFAFGLTLYIIMKMLIDNCTDDNFYEPCKSSEHFQLDMAFLEKAISEEKKRDDKVDIEKLHLLSSIKSIIEDCIQLYTARLYPSELLFKLLNEKDKHYDLYSKQFKKEKKITESFYDYDDKNNGQQSTSEEEKIFIEQIKNCNPLNIISKGPLQKLDNKKININECLVTKYLIKPYSEQNSNNNNNDYYNMNNNNMNNMNNNNMNNNYNYNMNNNNMNNNYMNNNYMNNNYMNNNYMNNNYNYNMNNNMSNTSLYDTMDNSNRSLSSNQSMQANNNRNPANSSMYDTYNQSSTGCIPINTQNNIAGSQSNHINSHSEISLNRFTHLNIPTNYSPIYNIPTNNNTPTNNTPTNYNRPNNMPNNNTPTNIPSINTPTNYMPNNNHSFNIPSTNIPTNYMSNNNTPTSYMPNNSPSFSIPSINIPTNNNTSTNNIPTNIPSINTPTINTPTNIPSINTPTANNYSGSTIYSINTNNMTNIDRANSTPSIPIPLSPNHDRQPSIMSFYSSQSSFNNSNKSLLNTSTSSNNNNNSSNSQYTSTEQPSYTIQEPDNHNNSLERISLYTKNNITNFNYNRDDFSSILSKNNAHYFICDIIKRINEHQYEPNWSILYYHEINEQENNPVADIQPYIYDGLPYILIFHTKKDEKDAGIYFGFYTEHLQYYECKANKESTAECIHEPENKIIYDTSVFLFTYECEKQLFHFYNLDDTRKSSFFTYTQPGALIMLGNETLCIVYRGSHESMVFHYKQEDSPFQEYPIFCELFDKIYPENNHIICIKSMFVIRAYL